MIAGTDQVTKSLGSSFAIDDDTSETLEEFVFLGSLLMADNKVSSEIRRRIINVCERLCLCSCIVLRSPFSNVQ